MLINGQEGSAVNYSEMSPIEIFEKINNHQLKGIMFHDSLISLFDFLYLPGFKRWQMCQLRSESEERCEFKHYVMRNHHKLLKDAPDTKEEIIPPKIGINILDLMLPHNLEDSMWKVHLSNIRNGKIRPKFCMNNVQKSFMIMVIF